MVGMASRIKPAMSFVARLIITVSFTPPFIAPVRPPRHHDFREGGLTSASPGPRHDRGVYGSWPNALAGHSIHHDDGGQLHFQLRMSREPGHLDGRRSWTVVSEIFPPHLVELVLLVDVRQVPGDLDHVAEGCPVPDGH